MSHGKEIAKNAAWLMAAQTAQKALSFLTFSVVARLVGVAVTGRFFYAVSVTSVFVILADLGLTPVLIRQMAQDETKGRAWLRTVFKLKVFFIPVAVTASLAYAYFTGDRGETLLAIALACLVMSADAVSLTWYGAIRGRRLLQYEAIGMFVGQVLTACGSLLSVWVFHAGVPGLVVGLLLGSLWNVFWSVWQARTMGLWPKAGDAAPPVETILRAAVPFALAGMFVKVYSYVDTLLLHEYRTETEVGYYALAYKITYAFQFLPLAFVAALYPGMSAAYASKEKDALQKILLGSLRLMTLIAAPLCGILSAFAPRFIPWVYGSAYQGAVWPLQVLAWVLLPIFWDFPVGSLLNATHRAEQKTTAMGIAMVVNVLANVVFVPTFGPVGAAWSANLSFWLLCAVGIWFVRNDLPSISAISSLFARGGLAACVIWALIWFATPPMPMVAAIIFCVACPLAVLFALRLFTLTDIRMVLGWLKKKAGVPDPVDERLHSRR
jgi:O-antigen/teichoic acid export membrane protein